MQKRMKTEKDYDAALEAMVKFMQEHWGYTAIDVKDAK